MQATFLKRVAEFVKTGAPSGGDTSLASGDNTITPASGLDCVLIVPKPGETVTMTVKGDAGDVGVVISNVYPTFLTVASGALVLNVSGNTTAQLVFGKLNNAL